MPSYDLIGGLAEILAGGISGYGEGKEKRRKAALAEQLTRQRMAGPGAKPMTEYQKRMLGFHEENLKIRQAVEGRADLLAKAKQSTINKDTKILLDKHDKFMEKWIVSTDEWNKLKGGAATLDEFGDPAVNPTEVKAGQRDVEKRFEELFASEETVLALKKHLDNKNLSAVRRLEIRKAIERIKRSREGKQMGPHIKTDMFEWLADEMMGGAFLRDRRKLLEYLAKVDSNPEEFLAWEKERE